jgi:hypothetical protein
MGNVKSSYKILVRNLRGRDKVGVGERIILKWIFDIYDFCMWTEQNYSSSKHSTVLQFLQHSTTPQLTVYNVSPVCMVKMMNDDVMTQLVSPTSKSKMLGILSSLVLVALGPLLELFARMEQMG